MGTQIDKQKENINTLLQLIKENPELPILPMASYEIFAEDTYCYWTGSWGRASVDSYCIANERVVFLSDGEEEVFEQIGGEIPVEETNEEEYIRNKVMQLEWIQAIIVYIELPN